MKKLFTIITVCLMSLQYAIAQDICIKQTIQEEMPQFIGGEEALDDWIVDNISNPLMSNVYFVEGRAVVTFDVNEDGSVSNIQVEETPDPMLVDVIENCLLQMPDWIPAMQNGRNVKVKYTLPIYFSAY